MKRFSALSGLPAVLVGLALLLAGCDFFGSGSDGPRLEGIPGKIVYSAHDESEDDPSQQIFVTDQEGTRQLTEADASYEYAVSPAWSPDGKRIVFSWAQGEALGKESLWIMNADGSEKRLVKEYPGSRFPQFGTEAAWSPSGDRIAFQECINCELGGKNTEIMVVDLESGRVDTLTSFPGRDAYPTWSPDGERLAFISGRDYINADSARYRTDLYVMNADGSDERRLTNSGRVGIPRWSPNGGKIAYAYEKVSAQLFFFDMTKAESIEVETDLEGRIKLFPSAWSPSGDQLFLTAGDYPDLQPYVLNLETGETRGVSAKSGAPIGVRVDWHVE